MNIPDAARILRLLLAGVNAATGEVLPDNPLLHQEEVRQALMTAVQVLDTTAAGTVPTTRSGRLNAGRPWTQQELDDLRSLYKSGMSVSEIARLTHRRVRGVRLQLNFMAGGCAYRDGRVPIPDVIGDESLSAMAAAAGQRASHRGFPWTITDEETLAALFSEGQTVSQPAKALGRSEYAVRLRLQKLGLITGDTEAEVSAADSPSPQENAYEPWTPETIAYLTLLHSEGWSIDEIAHTLGRTSSAIRSRLKKLGLPDMPPAADDDRPWTPADTQELNELSAKGLNISDIAIEMNRTPTGIRAHLLHTVSDSSTPAPQAPPPHPPQPEKAVAAISPSRRWTPEEDAYLRQAWAEGASIGDMCAHLNRRDRLVRCRLVYLDIADHAILDGQALPPELAHQGLPWYPEEIGMLQHMYRQGRSLEDMALTLRRAPAVVRNRLEMLGLIPD